jgi:hypothetical protein
MGKENKNKEPKKKGPPPPDTEITDYIKRDIGKK